jgi:hypothetical protein
MNDQAPTPECDRQRRVVLDAHNNPVEVVRYDFARKLERERNHWRGEALEQARLLGKGSEREARLLSMSVCELAAHNDNVRDYVSHWEGRTLAAEAEVARLKAENELFRNSQMFCGGCDEPTMKEHRELKAEVARLNELLIEARAAFQSMADKRDAKEAEAARLREALRYIASRPTDQLAAPQQCSMVAVAMEALNQRAENTLI